MSEKVGHSPSPIELLFPQGLALLEPKPITGLSHNAERWIRRFIIEPKFNGIRACVEIGDDGNVRIFTKEGNLAGFPRLKDRLRILGGGRNIVLDGEIIAGEGKTDRERQTVINQTFSTTPFGTNNIKFVAFDILMLDDVSLIDFPIEGRKRALVRVIAQGLREESKVILTAFALEDHLEFMEAAKQEKFEGVVLKRKGSKYREPHPRARSPHPWVKYKFKR